MKPLGSIKLTATINKISCQITAIVMQKLSHQFLLGLQACKDLNLVHKNFPRQQQVTNAIINEISTTFDSELHSIKEGLKEKFKDVLSDNLSSRPMKGPPMTIHINPATDVRPLRISTARQVPQKFAKQAAQVIRDLLKAGVIVAVTVPTAWCSPGFFVPKSDQISVRLVTDFSQLNRAILRPFHPFPSTRDILQSIPAIARFFAKLDAVHGYFQLALDEASSYLTTFLVAQGRFRYVLSLIHI